jgi:hypothetical protein
MSSRELENQMSDRDTTRDIEQDEEPDEAPTWKPSAAANGRRSRPSQGQRSAAYMLGVALLVAVAGVSFSAGRMTAAAATSTSSNGTAAVANASGRPAGRNLPSLAPGQTFNIGQFGAGRGAGTGAGTGGTSIASGGAITGQVVEIDGSTLTIQLANGTRVQVTTGTDTTYSSTASLDPNSISIGNTVTVLIGTGASASESPQPSASASGSSSQTRTISARSVIVSK